MLCKQATDEILESLKFDYSEDQLAMIMMKKTKDGTVMDKFMGKEIDGFFVEHSPGCKMHKVLHKETVNLLPRERAQTGQSPCPSHSHCRFGHVQRAPASGSV